MNTNTNEDKVQDNILSENSNNSFIEVLESYEESNTSSSNHLISLKQAKYHYLKLLPLSCSSLMLYQLFVL